jgi:hypothetical protein
LFCRRGDWSAEGGQGRKEKKETHEGNRKQVPHSRLQRCRCDGNSKYRYTSSAFDKKKGKSPEGVSVTATTEEKRGDEERERGK